MVWERGGWGGFEPFLFSEQEWVVGPLLFSARIPNGVGCAGRPRSLSCPCPGAWLVATVRDGAAGFLTPWGVRSGLDGPMPVRIALVCTGRCRPSPDRVPLGASPDRDARRIVPGNLPGLGGEWFLPVLSTPAAGVGGVDGDDRHAVCGGHRDEPGA